MNRPILWMAVALCVAIGLINYQAPFWMFFVGPVILIPLPFVWKSVSKVWVLAALIAYGVGIGVSIHAFNVTSPLSAAWGDERVVVGEVTEMPTIDETKTTFDLNLIQIDGKPVNGQIRTTLAHYDGVDTLGVTAGDCISLKGKLSPADKSRNPGGFDYAMYLKSQGVDGVLYTSDSDNIKIIGHRSGIKTGIAMLRAQLCATCDRVFPTDVSALMRGIVLGDRTDNTMRSTFSSIGVSHVLAVSGLHVGYVVLLVGGIASIFHLNARYKLILLIPVLGLYILLTGGATPVIRATLMVLTLVLGQVLRTHYDALNGLCLAALIILIFQPAQLFVAGFQMSFGAVLAIIVLYRPIVYSWSRRFWQPGPVLNSLILTACATVGTLPAVLHDYHVLHLITFVANIIVVPLIGILLMIGLVSIPLMTIVTVWDGILGLLPNALGRLVLSMTVALAKLPAIDVKRSGLSVLELILVVVLALVIAGYFNFRYRRQRLIVCTTVPALLLLMVVISLPAQPLRITYLDVGQGDSALIETPKGGTYLIDGGGYESFGDGFEGNKTPISEQVLLPALYSKGITHLDGVFISHNHADHAQGIEEILTAIPVNTIYVSTKYNGSLEKQDIVPVEVLSDGAVLTTPDGVTVQVLWPDVIHVAAPDDEQNAESMVMRLVYGKRSFLFTGDAESETEEKLKGIDSDVLKVGHHGSAAASSASFLSEVSPALAVISVGKNNWYGHPTPEVLQRLVDQGCRIYRTDEDGAVVITTNGEDLRVQTYLRDGGK